MRFNELMDRALFALSVPKCICCGERLNYGQKAFCLKCSLEFRDFKTRNCSRCAKILSECDCSNEHLQSHFIGRVIKCYRYLPINEKIPSNALVYSLKCDNRNDVLEVCANELEAAIRNSVVSPENYVITNVPRRKAAIIEYGIDHSELLAAEVAKRLGAEFIPILTSNAKKAQKSLQTTDRLKNADFEIAKCIDLKGRAVIIVDDIITSGASMSTAASLIRSLGCKSIIAAALAIAYKD